MKWIVTVYGGHPDIHGHDLWKLWSLCKETITYFGAEDEAISVVEQIIKDFHDLDKSALAFRYSINSKGFLTTLSSTVIDLDNIREVMESVNNFFKGLDGWLEQIEFPTTW